MPGLRPQYARGPLQRALPRAGLSIVAHTGIIPDAQVMPLPGSLRRFALACSRVWPNAVSRRLCHKNRRHRRRDRRPARRRRRWHRRRRDHPRGRRASPGGAFDGGPRCPRRTRLQPWLHRRAHPRRRGADQASRLGVQGRPGLHQPDHRELRVQRLPRHGPRRYRVGGRGRLDRPGWVRARVNAAGFAANAMALIGHNTIRTLTIGRAESRRATAAEIAVMRGHVQRAMEQGACGLSTGLIYTPGKWAPTDEIIDLARAAADGGGLYATHMRNEGDLLLESVAEAIQIGAESGCRVHISHHKASGHENWGKVADSLAVIDRVNSKGSDITLDFYPYIASSGPMAEYTSPETVTQERADQNQFATCPPFPQYQGRTVSAVAAAEALTLPDLVRQVLTAPGGRSTISIGVVMSDHDLVTY